MFLRKHAKKLFCGAVVCSIVGVFFINFRIVATTRESIFTSLEKVPKSEAALVLGAKVTTAGALSGVLEDRASTAVELYEAQKVKKILVSGDHGTKEYDEVNALKNYFLAAGVLPEDLFLDHAGFDTYDSLYRARDIFKAESLIIVTQNFHLPRAVYIAHGLDIEAVGFSADKHVYAGAVLQGRIRESLARVKAFGSLLFRVSPKFLGQAIPLTGTSTLSWD